MNISVSLSMAIDTKILYVLSAAYAAVGTVAFVQLVRIQLRVPEYGWTTQKLFHLLNLIVCICRVGLFSWHEPFRKLQNAALQLVLSDLPGLLFTTTYALLVLFWAEIYHQARTMPTGNLRPAFMMINVGFYACQALIWIVLAVDDNLHAESAFLISDLFSAILSVVAAGGFILYGGRLFFMLKSFPIDSRGRRKKIQEVGYVTTICTSSFTFRCALNIFSAVDAKHGNLFDMSHVRLTILYYAIVELVPSMLVLYILRKLPPKRSPQGYQAIPAA